MQFDQPNRREIITLVGGVAVSWPLAARAQQPAKLARIGVLASLPSPPLQRLSHKLREYGYVEGQNLRFEERFGEPPQRSASTSRLPSSPAPTR
jgi:putative ABC transport system substrate-binding protein